MNGVTLRVALVGDLLSERWPSMDLVADMLFAHLAAMESRPSIQVELLRPSLKPRGRVAGRYINRFWDYPQWLRGRSRDFDIFHVVDHSYAHLVHVLPASRTVVTCHDVDAFMPLIDATVIPSRLPKMFTRAVLSGMRKAAYVACDSVATYDEVRRFDLAAERQLVLVPMGVHPVMLEAPDTHAEEAVNRMLGPRRPDVIEMLHVGSTIPRKRIDVLLRILAQVRQADPRVRLLKAGGALTPAQRDLAATLGVAPHIVSIPFIDTRTLAALYRRADVTVIPSEREGFGLPMVEALASGTPVVATNLPVLREVGGDAAAFVTLEDIPRWCEAVLAVVNEPDEEARAARRRAGRERASRFSWSNCARAMADIYTRIAAGEPTRQSA